MSYFVVSNTDLQVLDSNNKALAISPEDALGTLRFEESNGNKKAYSVPATLLGFEKVEEAIRYAKAPTGGPAAPGEHFFIFEVEQIKKKSRLKSETVTFQENGKDVALSAKSLDFKNLQFNKASLSHVDQVQFRDPIDVSKTNVVDAINACITKLEKGPVTPATTTPAVGTTTPAANNAPSSAASQPTAASPAKEAEKSAWSWSSLLEPALGIGIPAAIFGLLNLAPAVSGFILAKTGLALGAELLAQTAISLGFGGLVYGAYRLGLAGYNYFSGPATDSKDATKDGKQGELVQQLGTTMNVTPGTTPAPAAGATPAAPAAGATPAAPAAGATPAPAAGAPAAPASAQASASDASKPPITPGLANLANSNAANDQTTAKALAEEAQQVHTSRRKRKTR